MSDYTLRPLNPSSEREMDTIVAFSMMTLWESRPNFALIPRGFPILASLPPKSCTKPVYKTPISAIHRPGCRCKHRRSFHYRTTNVKEMKNMATFGADTSCQTIERKG